MYYKLTIIFKFYIMLKGFGWGYCFSEYVFPIMSPYLLESVTNGTMLYVSGFLYLWTAMLVIFPAANAVIALTCGYYILQPLFPCGAPESAARLIAAITIGTYTYSSPPPSNISLFWSD